MKVFFFFLSLLCAYVSAQSDVSSTAMDKSSSSSSDYYVSSSSSSSSPTEPRLLLLNFTQVVPVSAPSFARRNAQLRRITGSSSFYFRDPRNGGTVRGVDPTLETAFLYFGGDTFNDVWLGRQGGTGWVQLMGPNLDYPFNETFTPGAYMSYCSQSDNTLVALCGKCLPQDATSDIFKSQFVVHTSSAQNWLSINTTAWSPRQESSCISDDTYLYHIAGNDWNSGEDTNSVWRSADSGVTWIRVAEYAPFAPRKEPALVSYYSPVFKHSMLYVIGGRVSAISSAAVGYNDVWVSSDYGQSFSFVTFAQWSARINPAVSITTDGVMVLVGGQSNRFIYNDVWVTVDGGYYWYRMFGTRKFSKRYVFPSVFDANSVLYIVGGAAEDNNDIWMSNVRFNNKTALSLLIFNVPDNVTDIGLQIWPSGPPARPSTSDTPVEGILIGFAAFIAVFGGFALYKFVDWKMLPCLKHRWITHTHLAMQSTNPTNTLNQQLLERSDRASFLD